MDSELLRKVEKVQQLSNSIRCAKEALKDNPSYSKAVAVQNLQRQREELQRLLPPLRVVNVQ